MFIKKDSLLLRIIFYNVTAIIILSSIMAFIFSLILFNELNTKLRDRAIEKVSLLSKTYAGVIDESREELYKSTVNSLNLITRVEKNKFIQSRLAEVIKNQLNLESYSKYNDSYVQVLNSNRSILGESGSREIKYDILSLDNFIPSKKTLENKKYYYRGTKENLYVSIIQKYKIDDFEQSGYIILTFPLSNYNFSKIRIMANLSVEDRIFLLSGDRYTKGELDLEENKKNKFLGIYRNEKFSKEFSNYFYYFSEKKLKEDSYYLAIMSVKDDRENISGSLGVAISKKNFIAVKYMLATSILAVCFLAILVSSALSSRIFTKLLQPLSILTEKTKKMDIEIEEIDFEEDGVYEIRVLTNSVKTMLEKIKEKEKLLKQKNEKLKINLDRIISIENILMGMDIEKNIINSIGKVLKALTSEVGMGYSRAIYMDYNQETNYLEAKEFSVNPYILSNIQNYTQGVGGFKFQISELENLLPLLKVKFENGNILKESMLSKKIIYHNDKGYKYNFGNDIFKSLGLNNFLILPIVDRDVNLGCIILDYFGKENLISDEEVEVMMLFLMNLIIRVKNDVIEESKIEKERILTMTKISNKFLNKNNEFIEKIQNIVEKAKSNGYNDRDMSKLNSYLEKEKKENMIIKEVIKTSNRKFKVFSLEKIIKKVVSDFGPSFKKYGINISLFIDFYGNIYAEKKKIYQIFVELLKNSMEAILIRNKVDKKINIILTKDDMGRVIIEVVDNGIGMSDEELESLRKPYLNEKDNIMGLGLTTVYKIVREHRGVIKISSKIDEETKVRIILSEYKEEEIKWMKRNM